MSPQNWALLSTAGSLTCYLLCRIANRKQREHATFEAKLSRLFNEVRSDSTTRQRFERLFPKDPPKL